MGLIVSIYLLYLFFIVCCQLTWWL